LSQTTVIVLLAPVLVTGAYAANVATAVGVEFRSEEVHVPVKLPEMEASPPAVTLSPEQTPRTATYSAPAGTVREIGDGVAEVPRL